MIEIPQWLWQPILRGIILNTRPAKSAHAYRQVWTERRLAAARRSRGARPRRLQQKLAGRAISVDWAMRYGNPGIAAKIEAMKAAGCERILLAPLYPQYCAATTATANDAAFAALAAMRWQPALRTLPPYYDDPLYIDALKADLERQIAALDFAPRPAAAELPRHAAAHAGAWRPLSLPLPQDRAAAGRSDGPRGRRRLPVAVRPRQMARAGDRRGARGLSRRGGDARSPSPRRAFPPIAWRRSRSWAFAAATDFLAAGGTHFARLDCLNDSAEGMRMLRTAGGART